MLPRDLHVLSLSLAFILSQDQTLHRRISSPHAELQHADNSIRNVAPGRGPKSQRRTGATHRLSLISLSPRNLPTKGKWGGMTVSTCFLYYISLVYVNLSKNSSLLRRRKHLPLRWEASFPVCGCKGTTIPKNGKAITQLLSHHNLTFLITHYIYYIAKGKNR